MHIADRDRNDVSRNVWVTLILCSFWGLADSIWAGAVLAGWLYILTEKNSSVGFVEAAQGVAALVFALPVGYLADKWGRSPVIKVGGVMFFLGTLATAYAVMFVEKLSHKSEYYLLMGCMVVWGIGQGIFNGPCQALFADSVPKGKRSKYYVYLMASYVLPQSIGALISYFIFHVHGDSWTVPFIRPIFLAGLAIELFPVFLSFLLRDDLAEDENSEDTENISSLEYAQLNPQETNEAVALSAQHKCALVSKTNIPLVMFIGDVLTALGSGMTVKFFPLYFKTSLSLNPGEVQLIYVIVPFFLIAFSQVFKMYFFLVYSFQFHFRIKFCPKRISNLTYFSQYILGDKIGRIQAVLVAKCIGICLLGLMSHFYFIKVVDPKIVVPIYVFRTASMFEGLFEALMNATYPLEESVLMDNVSKDKRARWKSLESIASFGWCGSAALGGIISDSKGYGYTFVITVILQLLGTVVLSSLIPVVEDEKSRENHSDVQNDSHQIDISHSDNDCDGDDAKELSAVVSNSLNESLIVHPEWWSEPL